MSNALQFEWDGAKAKINLAKHGVPFEYAAQVFLDPNRVEFDASRSEDGEARLKAVGRIDTRLYVVVFTMRGDSIRIISARRANATEQKAYDSIHPGPE